MGEQQTEQQGTTTDFLYLEEQIVEAYTTGGAPKCRRVTRAIFSTIERILTQQKSELAEAQSIPAAAVNDIDNAVDNLNVLINSFDPEDPMMEDLELARNQLLSALSLLTPDRPNFDPSLKPGGTA